MVWPDTIICFFYHSFIFYCFSLFSHFLWMTFLDSVDLLILQVYSGFILLEQNNR
jgi:hypothetical protein